MFHSVRLYFSRSLRSRREEVIVGVIILEKQVYFFRKKIFMEILFISADIYSYGNFN